jgi:hypothetical protein
MEGKDFLPSFHLLLRITEPIPCQGERSPLIHHQGIICGVAFDRSSGIIHNLLISVLIPKLGGGFWSH